MQIILYFTFEILNYAIKYKILQLLLSYLAVMISCKKSIYYIKQNILI